MQSSHFSISSTEIGSLFIGAIMLVGFMNIEDPFISRVAWFSSFVPMLLAYFHHTERFLVGKEQLTDAHSSLQSLGGFQAIETLINKLLFASVQYGVIRAGGFETTDRDIVMRDPSGAICVRMVQVSPFYGPFIAAVNPVTLYCSHASGFLLLSCAASFLTFFLLYAVFSSQASYVIAELGFKKRVIHVIGIKDRDTLEVSQHVVSIRQTAQEIITFARQEMHRCGPASPAPTERVLAFPRLFLPTVASPTSVASQVGQGAQTG